jgi:hypothetical protein
MIKFKDMRQFPDTGVIESLPDLPVPDEPIPSETSTASEVFTVGDPDELPRTMVESAKEYGEESRSIKAAESKIKLRKADLRLKEEALYATFEDVGITSFSTGGYTYFARIDTYASVDAAKRGAAFKWLRDIGYDYLIKETVNAQSLTAEVKKHIEETQETPGEDEGIKIRIVNRVGVRKK